jgi:hypothetical protein
MWHGYQTLQGLTVLRVAAQSSIPQSSHEEKDRDACSHVHEPPNQIAVTEQKEKHIEKRIVVVLEDHPHHDEWGQGNRTAVVL